MSHYYSEKQDDIESNPSELIYKFNYHSFKFHTDKGVF